MNISKKFLACGIALCSIAAAVAAPAKPGLRTISQPDGSTISVRLVGDEFFHTYVTSDGLTVARGADGYFYYNTPEGLSKVRATNPATRAASETEFIKQNSTKLSVQSNVKARKNQAGSRLARRAVAKANNNSFTQVPQQGSPGIPVILVQYKDYKFKDSDPKKTFTEFFESGEKSGRQYFVDQSNGKFTPEFDVYGPYTLSGNRVDYGGNDYEGNDKGVCTMVAQGCLAGDSEIDFTKYDNDGDGECDVVIVLYAGDGEASSYDEDAEDAVWPMQWELSGTGSDYGKALTLDKTIVDKFAVFNELNGSNLSRIDGVGTFCHEFSHCLGLPDFYDTNYGPHFGMGPWSLLDSGCYNDDGYTPIGYTAYEKNFMGWIDLEEGKQNTLYTLSPLNMGADRAVKLTNAKDKNEYYILENRKKQGWDKYMGYDGLFIYHVTYSASAWNNNTVNDYDLQRMTPVPADGTLKLDKESYRGETYYYINEADLAGDLWPYGNANELTDTSTPAAEVNTGSLLGKPITQITRNADGTISFWCMKDKKPAVAAPVSISHKNLSGNSAEVVWTAGDDNDVTYTLEVAPHKEITYSLISSTTFDSNNHGWTTDGFVDYESAEGGVRLGSNKNPGILTSKNFTPDDDVVTVKFVAKAYGNDAAAPEVSLLKNGSKQTTLSSESVALSKSYVEYTVVLTGAAGNNCLIEIAADNKKRCYVKSVEIYSGDASAAKAKGFAPAAARTFEGIIGTSYVVTDLEAGQKYDCRVKAVAKDVGNFDNSDWSPVYVLEYSTATSAAEIVETVAAEPEYYTLQGIRLGGTPTAAGIYIVRRGDKTQKILVK